MCHSLIVIRSVQIFIHRHCIVQVDIYVSMLLKCKLLYGCVQRDLSIFNTFFLSFAQRHFEFIFQMNFKVVSKLHVILDDD